MKEEKKERKMLEELKLYESYHNFAQMSKISEHVVFHVNRAMLAHRSHNPVYEEEKSWIYQPHYKRSSSN